MSQSKVSLLESSYIVDRFIADVLLPSKINSIPTRSLYDVFLQYCDQLELVSPTIGYFSRQLGTRFQRRRVKGNMEYYCEVQPELLAVEEVEIDGPDDPI